MQFADRGLGPLRSFSIRARLVLGFGALIALLGAAAALGAWRMSQLSGMVGEMAAVDVPLQRVVGEWFSLTRSNAVRAVVLTQSDDEELRTLLTPAMEAATRRISVLQQEVQSLAADAQGQALFGRVSQRRQAYLEARKAVLERKRAGDV